MEWLRIEFGSELLDIILRDLDGFTFETHPQGQIFEPFDHRSSLSQRGHPVSTTAFLKGGWFRRRGEKKTAGFRPPLLFRWIAGSSPAMTLWEWLRDAVILRCELLRASKDD
jgi:hypothetical protein